ncbi:unnamed protein product [Urochloa humidicola]
MDRSQFQRISAPSCASCCPSALPVPLDAILHLGPLAAPVASRFLQVPLAVTGFVPAARCLQQQLVYHYQRGEERQLRPEEFFLGYFGRKNLSYRKHKVVS